MTEQNELEAALYLLREFLEREKRRERQGITLEAVYDLVTDTKKIGDRNARHIETVIKDQIATNLRLDRYGRRLRKLERMRVDGTSEPPSDEKDEGEITGNFRVIDEQRAVEIASQRARLDALEGERREVKETASFWRDWRAKLVAAVVVAMFTAGCSGTGGVLVYYLTKGSGR